MIVDSDKHYHNQLPNTNEMKNMDTPIAAGNLSLEELSAELQKGLDSIKNDRTYSADEVDAEIDAYINQDFSNS